MYEQSHRDYLRSGYLHHRLPVWAVNHYVITPLPTKPSATKMPGSEAGERSSTDMQMRQRDVAALDAKYTKLAGIKAENDALRDDVALVVVGCIKAVCQSVREATTASGVDNAASQTGRRLPLSRIISPSERG